ncbi:uncharacterized protein [Miscanthus floridulus]|uniref:uncharacterized protein n=1 Tax=Miscanthus floridulus TaxID=154761 RepID=UPI003458438D
MASANEIPAGASTTTAFDESLHCSCRLPVPAAELSSACPDGYCACLQCSQAAGARYHVHGSAHGLDQFFLSRTSNAGLLLPATDCRAHTTEGEESSAGQPPSPDPALGPNHVLCSSIGSNPPLCLHRPPPAGVDPHPTGSAMFCILLLDEDAASRTLPYCPAVPGYAAAKLLQLGDVYGNDEHRSQDRSCDWACFRGTTIVDSNILTPMAMNERSHLPLEEEAEFVMRRWISFYLVKEGNRKSIYSDQHHRLRETTQ